MTRSVTYVQQMVFFISVTSKDHMLDLTYVQVLQAMEYSKQLSFWDLEVDGLIVVLTSPFLLFSSVLKPLLLPVMNIFFIEKPFLVW